MEGGGDVPLTARLVRAPSQNACFRSRGESYWSPLEQEWDGRRELGVTPFM
jgi:hypothetical protein